MTPNAVCAAACAAPSSNIRSCSCGNSGDEDGQGPGGVVWDCGIALAQSISRGWPVELRGKRVLELGAGTGLGFPAAATIHAMDPSEFLFVGVS